MTYSIAIELAKAHNFAPIPVVCSQTIIRRTLFNSTMAKSKRRNDRWGPLMEMNRRAEQVFNLPTMLIDCVLLDNCTNDGDDVHTCSYSASDTGTRECVA